MNRRLSLHNRQRVRAVDLRLLRGIVQTALDDLPAVDAYDLGIYLVAAPEMTRLNESFLRHEGVTDVLTFDYAEPGTGSLERQIRLHGDIFVCIEEAVVQARRFRTTWQSEIVRYILHGILHLRGYDDLRSAARRRMKREEHRLLRILSRRFSFSGLSGAKLRRARARR